MGCTAKEKESLIFTKYSIRENGFSKRLIGFTAAELSVSVFLESILFSVVKCPVADADNEFSVAEFDLPHGYGLLLSSLNLDNKRQKVKDCSAIKRSRISVRFKKFKVCKLAYKICISCVFHKICIDM